MRRDDDVLLGQLASTQDSSDVLGGELAQDEPRAQARAQAQGKDFSFPCGPAAKISSAFRPVFARSRCSSVCGTRAPGSTEPLPGWFPSRQTMFSKGACRAKKGNGRWRAISGVKTRIIPTAPRCARRRDLTTLSE